MRQKTPGAALPGGRGCVRRGCPGRQRDPLPARVDELPPAPAPYAEALDRGLRQLGIVLRTDQRAAIDGHVRLLLAWNAAINLTAIHDPAEIARLHVLDSLTAVALLRMQHAGRFLDLGSGGGFPGLPLAIALDAEALLVDSVGKKIRFLEVAASALRISSVSAVTARAETLAADRRHREAWPAVTARAVAPLADVVELAFPLLAPGGVLVAWKRGDIEAELRAAEPAVAALGGGVLEVVGPSLDTLAEHRLAVARKTGRTGEAWPRDPAARRRRPW